uniref:hypothetical protein n=1 Tax=Corallococcus coralloides TaxID=184914 RepID=UPI000FFF2B30|nr:hypothetical protein [Corallococcus coralloides]
MPFFIPGSTTCVLCGKPIQQRVEATQLPLLDVASAPAFAPLVRRFVHRHCWEGYPQRDGYAHAARELILQANPEEITPLYFERDGLFLLGVPAARAFRVKDTWGPFEADVPAPKAARLAKGVLAAFEQQMTSEHALGSATWRLAPSKRGVVLTLSSEEEAFDQMEIPLTKQPAWSDLMRKLQQVATGT